MEKTVENENLNKSNGFGSELIYESNAAEDWSDSVSERVFPCRSDTEVKVALELLLHSPKVRVEVAGGIVRHDLR